MTKGGGIITAADLAHYAPQWRDPVTFTYSGHEIISMPPPSSGGVTHTGAIVTHAKQSRARTESSSFATAALCAAGTASGMSDPSDR